ncbi:MAG: hypothetical protein MJ188_08405 [Treponema sp.]|nr:hypothetical protein [Treponema sp.]
MKKIVCLILTFCVLGSINSFAQVKTKFTQQSSISNSSKPTGAIEEKGEKIKNSVDVKVPTITRGIERYPKLNIFGEIITDDFLFYRGLLNEREQVIYDQLYNVMMEGENMIVTQARITEDELQDVLDALQYDNPEIFWWAGAHTWWSNSDDIVTKIRLNCWIDLSELQNYYDKFCKMTVPVLYYASFLPDDMSKIKYVHDYICLSTDYDYESYNSSNVGGKLQTAYSCAVDYLTVCAGYSSAFQFYMQQLGIPCTSISGSSHQWNLLKVNNQYYQMDVTWDDNQLIPSYYNLPHSEMQKIDSHTPSDLGARLINKYPSSGTEMSYINYHGMLLEGTPYLYKELENFDYSLDFQESNYIYTTAEKRLPIVKNMTDFYNLLKDQLEVPDDGEFSVKGATPDSDLTNQISYELKGDNDVVDLIFEKRPEANGYHFHFDENQIQDYTIFEITFTLK